MIGINIINIYKSWPYLAGDLTHLSEKAAEEGRLAGANRPDDCSQRTALDLNVDPLQHCGTTVVRVFIPRKITVLHLNSYSRLAAFVGPIHRALLQLATCQVFVQPMYHHHPSLISWICNVTYFSNF